MLIVVITMIICYGSIFVSCVKHIAHLFFIETHEITFITSSL